VRRGHPWLYADAIRRQSHEGPAGNLAVLFDRRRRFLAIGLYDPTSPIRARILHAGQPANINTAWFQSKLTAAYNKRSSLHIDPNTTGYRLVNGENDGLPGLVIDRFASVGVVKIDTPAWLPYLHEFLLPALPRGMPLTQLVLRFSRSIALADRLGYEDGQTILGSIVHRPVTFLENGLCFAADVVSGQKTGFFFDHRENRSRVEKHSPGRQVLNVFSYSGSFSLYAARGGARQVVDLDASQQALAAAAHNFQLNQHIPTVAAAEHSMIANDAFAGLRELAQANRHFDMVIIDPPAMARKASDLEKALAAYRHLVTGGLAVLQPGGILVMASCTGRVTAETFFTLVHQTANEAKRPLKEITRTGHAPDHPVAFKEGAYLKCLFATAG